MPRAKRSTEATPATTPKPPLPHGWTWVRFDEIAVNVSDRVDDPRTAGVDHYVGLEHLDSDSLKIRRWGTPDDVEAQKLRFRAGDIIFGKRRAYQRKVGVAEFDGICSAHAFVFRGNQKHIVPELLPFFMQTDAFMERAVAISKGSLSPTINWGDLARQEFALPSDLAEQRRIADLLRAADDAVEAWRGVAEEVSTARRNIFEQLTSQQGQATSKLGDALVEIIAGVSPEASNTPAEESRYGVLKVSAVGDGEYVESENKALLKDDDFDPEYEVKPGFLLVTRANALRSGVGRACRVEKTRPGLMLSDKTLRLVPNSKKVNELFLFESLRSRLYRQYVEANLNGTDAKNISQAKLRQAPIPLPPLPEQERVMAKITAIRDGSKDVESHLHKAIALENQLLTLLLTPPETP